MKKYNYYDLFPYEPRKIAGPRNSATATNNMGESVSS